MRKAQIISLAVLIITLLIMGINIFVSPLSDGIVRIDGMILLFALAAVSYCTVKISRGNE